MNHVFRILSIIFLASLIIGCTLANRSKWKTGHIAPEQSAVNGVLSGERGDAFLYDLKITNQGRKNSVRLDLYRKTDSLGIYARGYLGKGVLKGLITKDSIVIYFPTENEFYQGRINSLLLDNCLKDFPFERVIISIFGTTPDKVDYNFGDAYLTVLEDKSEEREFRLESKKCSEFIKLSYDWNSARFILNQLDYVSEDARFKLKANMRKFRLNVDLPEEKFRVTIPETAIRIYP